jgi:tetratricopeptide (TPR) repeat protein
MLRRESLLVLLLSIVAFLPSLSDSFVYDDVPLVRDDARVARGDVGAAFTTPYWGERHGGLYRPVTTLSFVLEGRLSRAALGFHAVNLALHGASAVLVLALARKLLGRGRAAFLAALVFAVHPIHAEVAANVVGRGESLGLLLGGSAWLLARDGRPISLVVASVLALLAVLAKESAIVLALAAPLELLLVRRSPGRAAVAAAPACFALAIALGLRTFMLGPEALTPATQGIAPFMNPLATEALGVRLANAPLLLLTYLEHLAVPLRLAPDYGGSALPLAASAGDPRVFAWALASAVALVAPALLAREHARALGFASAFLVLALAPVLQLVPIGTLLADRLAYAASIGFALAAGVALDAIARRFRGAGRLFVALLVGGLAGLALLEARAWSDGLTLFERAHARSHGSVQIPLDLGKMRLARARELEASSGPAAREEYALAVEPLEEASRLAPDDPGPLLLLGEALRELGRLGEARRSLERALALHPREEAAGRSELGLVLLAQGERDLALDQLFQSAFLEPGYRTCAIAGQLLAERGDRWWARHELELSLALEPRQESAPRIRELLLSLTKD